MEADSVVDRVYESMKGLVVSYALKPGERVNEVEHSKQLGVSRTPLREALNRLGTEGLLDFIPKRGYFCRNLNPKEIFDLYELRKAIEISGIRLATRVATDEKIEALTRLLGDVEFGSESGTGEELAQLDETFHERLLEMSGNAEMLRVLRNVNSRIRFVRWTNWDQVARIKSRADHRAVLSALHLRHEQEAVEILEKHISRRMDQITSAIKERLSHIYLGAQDLSEAVKD
ncbi:MAG: GntR family transcriptional regulator [Candidatus Acidiferrales bacterium]